MKRVIRKNVFETNSSNTHSITICTKKEFEDWKNGKSLFDEYNGNFIHAKELTNEQKKDAYEYYNDTRKPWCKSWDELSEYEKNQYYEDYAIELLLKDEDGITYETWKDGELDTYHKGFKTEHGDEIVAFGTYGYN